MLSIGIGLWKKNLRDIDITPLAIQLEFLDALRQSAEVGEHHVKRFLGKDEERGCPPGQPLIRECRNNQQDEGNQASRWVQPYHIEKATGDNGGVKSHGRDTGQRVDDNVDILCKGGQQRACLDLLQVLQRSAQNKRSQSSPQLKDDLVC